MNKLIFLISVFAILHIFPPDSLGQTKKVAKKAGVAKKTQAKSVARPKGDFALSSSSETFSDDLVPLRPLCAGVDVLPPGNSGSSGFYNISSEDGKIQNSPKVIKPEYPAAARAVKASGPVKVQVLIDEEGNVVCAAARSGHPLLRSASEKAALATKFGITMLEGRKVRVTGFIAYNFVAQ